MTTVTQASGLVPYAEGTFWRTEHLRGADAPKHDGAAVGRIFCDESGQSVGLPPNLGRAGLTRGYEESLRRADAAVIG